MSVSVLYALLLRCCYRFDPAAASFTLESVVSLRLDQHAEFIAELSVNATKELAIENSLAVIAATWDGLSLDLAEYKGTFKLRSTEDIFAALEDNSVTLSTMKASKYYLVFEQQVGHWESTLALVSETVEVVLQVGRAWQACVCVRASVRACMLAVSTSWWLCRMCVRAWVRAFDL
jgi:dynein heavy chain